ncbi:MAG: hypothetical protein IPH37_19180 [Burkholderiales bacterium]|nr:hypothetical protein [Burkholderiales bacterium]
MAVFAPRYLALCHSRIAPTVTLALDAVAALYRAGAVAEPPVCEALQAVVNSAVKGRVLSALELLGQIRFQKEARPCAPCQSGIASCARLTSCHRTRCAKKTLACLKAWGLDTHARAAHTYLPYGGDR